MNEAFWAFVFGGIAGGFLGFIFKGVEKWWLDFQLMEKIEARRKIKQYAKPLWLDCYDLSYRLNQIIEQRNNPHRSHELFPLYKIPRQEKRSIDWYTKEGYFIISTAYLIASVACWIYIFERDIVFLNFGRTSKTAVFFKEIENLKSIFSKPPSPLYFYYFNSIGEQLIDKNKNIPIGMANFSIKLQTDTIFSEYYDQLFQFIKYLAESSDIELVKNIVHQLEKIISILEKNGAIRLNKYKNN